MYHFVQYLFVPFHFYLVMTLVVPSDSLDNIYIYGFADLCTCKNWCDKTYFLDSGSPRGERGGGFVRAWAWFVIIV